MEEEHSDVCAACANGLALMAELGDIRAIQKLFAEEVQDCSDTVREAAVEILGKVAGKDDVGVRLWDTKV